MVNKSLVEYVREQLSHGYPPSTVRTMLLRAGYGEQEADEAIRTALQPGKRLEITGKTMIAILGAILAIITLIISGYIVFRPAPKDMQVDVRTETPTLLPGETLKFTITLTSSQARTTPVALTYTIREFFSKQTITTRTDQLNVGLSAVSTKRIPLSETIKPGEYEIVATARFERMTRTQTARFKVQEAKAPVEEVVEEKISEAPVEEKVSEITEEQECPGGCDDLNPATEDLCVRGECVHNLIPGCGNGECEPEENSVVCPEDCGPVQDKTAVINHALRIVNSDPQKASTLCTSLIIPKNTDACFNAIANASRKSAFCENIKDLATKDNCLITFAIDYNDYSVCAKLSDKWFIISCQSLARHSTLKQEQALAEQEAKETEQEPAQ